MAELFDTKSCFLGVRMTMNDWQKLAQLCTKAQRTQSDMVRFLIQSADVSTLGPMGFLATAATGGEDGALS